MKRLIPKEYADMIVRIRTGCMHGLKISALPQAGSFDNYPVIDVEVQCEVCDAPVTVETVGCELEEIKEKEDECKTKTITRKQFRIQESKEIRDRQNEQSK